MELIPIREAARRLGISDTSVRKAIKAGRITKPLDEDQDPSNDRPRLRWPDCRDQYLENSNATKRTHVGGQEGSKRRRHDEPPVAAAPEPQEPPAATTWMEPQPHGGSLMRTVAPEPPPLTLDANGDPVITNDMTLADAQRVKAILAGRQALLELKRDREQLVDRDKVRAAAFRMARSARDALQTMEDRLAPILASLTDLQEVRRVLREDIRRTCERIAAETEKL